MTPDEKIYQLIVYGVSKIPRLNDFTSEIDELREMKDEELAVAIICYGASLAKLTHLNLSDYLKLSVGAYQNVEISPKAKPSATETDAEKES